MASTLIGLPAPGSAEVNKAARKAAFIRDTAARIVVADLQRDKSTFLDQDVDIAEKLAEILSERGHL